MPSKTSPIYQLKISLDHTRPAVWRRFLVPAIMPLGRLHDVIQVVMGWTNSHLHQFTVDNQTYGDPTLDVDQELGYLNEWQVRLKQLIAKTGTRFIYQYDFGDSWDHTLVLEKILPPDPQMRQPLCLEGARACPPEDVGGVPGYSRFLQAIRNPKDEEHEEYLVWAGGAFDPEAFDLQSINRRLRKLKKRDTLDVEDWGYQPEYREPVQPAPAPDVAWMDEFSRQHQSLAEALPLRRDMRTFLQYLQANRVTGTQSTGNLPLKAGEAICALLTKPIPFGSVIGDHVYKVQSASEVWPLFFLHILASSAGLVEGGPARRWRVTGLGEKYLQALEGVQTWLLFYTWWTQVNWGIAASYAPENFPTQHLRPVALQHLLHLPLERPLPFDLFADQLIAAAHLSWPAGDAENQRSILHGLIESIVAEPLRDFGVLELTTGPHPTLGADFLVVSALKLTAFGREMLLHLEGNLNYDNPDSLTEIAA